MKSAIIIASAILTECALAMPSSNNFHAVTNDWYNGNFSNVYELAQMRLAANSNDVVGAYMMLDWDMAFSDYATISNSMMRVVANSDLITVPSFTNAYGRCRSMCISFCEDYIPRQDETMREAAQENSRKQFGFMTNQGMLRILWNEGLW